MQKPFQSILLLLVVLYACNVEAPQSTPDDVPNRYYDLNRFFEEEIKRLNEEQPVVNKTIVLNGETEQQTVEEVNFSNELLIFNESHINKVSWWGKYDGDTTFYAGGEKKQIKKIRYTANDEALKTKEIRISFSPQEKLDSLFIFNSTQSPTITTRQELVYIPDVKYEIYSEEKVVVSKNRELIIRGVFEKNKKKEAALPQHYLSPNQIKNLYLVSLVQMYILIVKNTITNLIKN